MKKFLSYILIIFMAFTVSSCNKSQKEKSEETDKFDIKIATNILNTYMNYLSQGDIESAKKMYSKDLSEKVKSVSTTDLKIEGFKLDEINEVGQTGLFRVRVTRAATDKPMTVLDVYNIKVEKDNNEYKISEVKSMTEREAFLEDIGLRMRQKNNVKTNLIVDIGGIPQYAYPKDDKANINKGSIPKENFGVMNFAYSGEKIAVSTFSKDAYIGVIKIDESMAVQGGGGGGAGGAGGGGQSGGAGAGAGGGGAAGAGGSNMRIKEPPIGKEITSIDLIKDAKIELLSFSLDEKFIVVQYSKSQQGTTLRLYDADSGDLAPMKFEEEYPAGKVDVVFSSFDKDVLNYEVKESKNSDKSVSGLIGKWQYDLKNNKAKKL